MGTDQQQQQYNTPATFVNVKRVRTGEQDSKGRDKTVLTFGLGKDPQGNEVNGLDSLISALLPYQGKQVNFAIHVEEKTTPQGRTFPSAFVKITEMIPKDQGGGPQGKTVYAPKAQSRSEAVKATAAAIKSKFAAE